MSLIEVKGLCKSFGNLEVLKDVSFTVDEGEVVVIIGGSGCGKSVTLRSIELLEKTDKGQIFVGGREITAKGADIDSIRRQMGMVYQSFNLFSHMNIEENMILAPTKLLKMPREEAIAKAKDLLKQVGLLDKLHAMPANLSGGQKQRVAIARCLMMEPKIMLFDEPTSALDPTMVGEVLATMRMLAKKGMTMIIVTHEMNFAKEIGSRIMFLADKGVYEQGTPAEIFDNPQKEKTIAFIKKLKFISMHIESRDFDLMELHGNITTFGERYGLGSKAAYRLQLCAEELIYEMFKCAEDEIDTELSIEYSESEKCIQLNINAKGKEYNPFTLEDDDEPMGVMIVKRTAQNYSHSYENGTNKISIQI